MSGHSRRVQLYAAVLAVVATVVMDAQSPPWARAPRTLRSSVEVTAVTVTVRDADGRLAGDLPREAFSVYEDGEPVEITQFTHERVPVALGLLLDVSDSMFGQRILDARGGRAIPARAPGAGRRVLRDGVQPRADAVTPWTSEPETARAALDAIKPSGGTAIYDTVLRALPLIESRPRDRAALVLISDGADTASDATLRDLRAELLRTDAFIYAVAIDSPGRQAINTRVNPEALARSPTRPADVPRSCTTRRIWRQPRRASPRSSIISTSSATHRRTRETGSTTASASK